MSWLLPEWPYKFVYYKSGIFATAMIHFFSKELNSTQPLKELNMFSYLTNSYYLLFYTLSFQQNYNFN